MGEVLPLILYGTILRVTAEGEETPVEEGSGHCVDRLGGLVGHGDRYTPRGKEPCEKCTCQRGRPDSCFITSCSPPDQCQAPYLRGSGECCDYACNGTLPGSPDGADVLSATNLGLRLVASTVTSFLILALLLFMIHRLRKRRLLVMIRRLNGCRASAADLEDACLARQLALDDRGGFLGPLCPEPPPPYSFWKPPEAYVPPGEAPPPYEAPPVVPIFALPLQTQVVQQTAVCDQVSRITQTTPPLSEVVSSSSSDGEMAVQERPASGAIRSDAYYEDGRPHVTVVRVGVGGEGAARRSGVQGRRLVQDGDKRLSLQAAPLSENNNPYPDPTSWHGEEEGDTTSSGSASPDTRRGGAFSPTSSESSGVAEGNDTQPPTAPARTSRAGRSFDRTLQQLRRLSIPGKSSSKKQASNHDGPSSSHRESRDTLRSDGEDCRRKVGRKADGTPASQICREATERCGGNDRLPPPDAEDGVALGGDNDTAGRSEECQRKKSSRRGILSPFCQEPTGTRKSPPRGAAESTSQINCEPRCASRPVSLELPVAASASRPSSAIPVVITVKCGSMRTSDGGGVSQVDAHPQLSRSSSICSETGERRTRTPDPPSDGGTNCAVSLQPYEVVSVRAVPRQNVARQVARLEAEGFRPPDPSARRRCGGNMNPPCRGQGPALPP